MKSLLGVLGAFSEVDPQLSQPLTSCPNHEVVVKAHNIYRASSVANRSIRLHTHASRCVRYFSCIHNVYASNAALTRAATSAASRKRAAQVAARSRVANSAAPHVRVRCATLRAVQPRVARPRPRACRAQRCSHHTNVVVACAGQAQAQASPPCHRHVC